MTDAADATGAADALVIGAGPAGLMAAERLAAAGLCVHLCEAKPSVGRKFLMAGKSGLNLTKDEPLADFLSAYSTGSTSAADRFAAAVAAFGPEAVITWARGLNQEVFSGSTGRVFPRAMKASPLLRAWLARLGELGVVFHTRWRWTRWEEQGFGFDTPDGPREIRPGVAVLALGGASWSRLGSDGAWAPLLGAKGISVAPFAPANFGLSVDWSPYMARHFGAPVKGVALTAGTMRSRGEFVVSKRGLEGGGIYALSRPLRDRAALSLDLRPDLGAAEVSERLARPRGKASLTNFLRKTLKLDGVKLALLQEFGRPLPQGEALGAMIKALPLNVSGPRPLDEAISTAGGVSLTEVTEGFMLKQAPGVFVAGEMLDWEAPTGGYLMTACLATGRRAGEAAARWAAKGA